MHNHRLPVFVALIVILLSSCGWHLRGQPGVASDNTASSEELSFALLADDIYTPMYRVFKNTYEKHRINLNNTENRPQLKLLQEVTRTRILSLNTELDPGESELTYRIDYQITLPKQAAQIYHIELYRIYIQDKNRASASDNETGKLVSEMRIEAAEKVLNQIVALTSPKTHTP